MEEPFCVCGHDEHKHQVPFLGRCYGAVGPEFCTCLGYREGKRSREGEES